MKKIALYTFLLCSGMLFAAGTENQARDKTNAVVNVKTRLTLRMKPTIKSARAGFLNAGTRVQVTAQEGAWMEIASPEQLKVYVSEVYLINGKLTNATNIRAGKSAEAPSFGVFPAGTALKAVGTGDRYGWIQVVPPESIKVYAYSDYIIMDKDAVIKTGEKAETKPDAGTGTVKEEVKEVKKAEIIPVPENLPVELPKEIKKEEAPAVKTEAVKEEKKEEVSTGKTPAVKEEKKEVKAVKPTDDTAKKIQSDLVELGAVDSKEKLTVSGTVTRIPASTSVATDYALLKDGKNQGYVCGKDFSKLNGKEYTATGRVYRINGWKAPIIVID